MFNNHADKPLNTAEHGTVYHNGALAAFAGDIFQIKALGQVEIKLNGGKLPQAANRIHYFNINLRPVESGFARVGGVRNVIGFQYMFQGVFRTVPIFYIAGKMFRVLRVPRGKFHGVFFKAERFENVHGKFKTLFHFVFHLFRRAENVRIILRKPAHAQKPVQRAGAFIAVNGAQFAKAQGQIPVAAQVGAVNFHMEGAVHGFNLVLFAVYFHGVEHTVRIKPGVAADFKQVQARNMGADNQIITAF